MYLHDYYYCCCYGIIIGIAVENAETMIGVVIKWKSFLRMSCRLPALSASKYRWRMASKPSKVELAGEGGKTVQGGVETADIRLSFPRQKSGERAPRGIRGQTSCITAVNTIFLSLCSERVAIFYCLAVDDDEADFTFNFLSAFTWATADPNLSIGKEPNQVEMTATEQSRVLLHLLSLSLLRLLPLISPSGFNSFFYPSTYYYSRRHSKQLSRFGSKCIHAWSVWDWIGTVYIYCSIR